MGRDYLFQGKFLKMVNNLLKRTPFLCKLTNPQPLHPQPSPYQTLTHQANISPVQIYPGTGIRRLKIIPTAQRPLTLYKLSIPKLLTLPFLSYRNPSEEPGLGFLLAPASSWQKPDASIVALHGMLCSLLLRNVSNKCYFQWYGPTFVGPQSKLHKLSPR